MKNISKLLAILLAGIMLLSVTSCAWIESIIGGNEEPPVTDDPNPDDKPDDPETPVEQDYKITFHYDFAADATLDENGKASAYESTAEYTSKKGKRVSLTTAMKEMFAMDGYKIKGYSTTAWQKDGISADMDVYVLYEALGYFTITFQNPDGSVISTLNKKEGEALAASEYPAVSDVTIAEGYEFIGWDITSIESVTESVTIKAKQGITRKFEAETFVSAVYDNAAAVAAPTGNSYSGGQYVHCEYISSKGFATITWELQSEGATSAIFNMALAHRAAKFYNINQCIQLFVNDQQVDIFADSAFTIDGWGVDTNGDGTKGGWSKFEEINVANIALVDGKNTITIKTVVSAAFEIDYFSLKGDVEGVYMNPYELTLSGATFANGKTTVKLEAGSGLPTGIQLEIPAGKKLSGWTDGTTTWGTTDFVMPEANTTISPVFVDQVSPEKEVLVTKEIITVDGVLDDAYQQVNSAAGYIANTKNDNLKGDVYMAAKANGVYVYIEITDDKVVCRGLEAAKDESKATGFKNDMIEFWFQYGDIHSKIQLDAFGLSLKSIADGLATSFANLEDVVYATKIIGDDLSGYTEGEAYASESATGYAVEFWLPLAEEGTSVADSTLTWTLQINSVGDIGGGNVSVYGWKMKTEAELLELDKIFKANFIKVDSDEATTIYVEAESETVNYYYYDASGARKMKEVDASTLMGTKDTANDGDYLKFTAKAEADSKSGYYNGIEITYTVVVPEGKTLSLLLAMTGHKDTKTLVSDYVSLYIDGSTTKATVTDSTITALGTLETFDLGLTLEAGTHTIRVLTRNSLPVSLDCLILTDDANLIAAATKAA